MVGHSPLGMGNLVGQSYRNGMKTNGHVDSSGCQWCSLAAFCRVDGIQNLEGHSPFEEVTADRGSLRPI
jgi:hypothetical protein